MDHPGLGRGVVVRGLRDVVAIVHHMGFHDMISSRIGPKMNSMVPSIPFLDFRGALIAALKNFDPLVGFHHVTLLFGHFFYQNCSLLI